MLSFEITAGAIFLRRFILPYDRQEFYFLVQREAFQEPNNLTAWTEPSEEWGMRNSLFRNWIQLAALSDFRKPYAKIDSVSFTMATEKVREQ